LKHYQLTVKDIGLIIVAMPESPKKRSKESQENNNPQRGCAASDHTPSSLLGESIVQSLPVGIVAFDADLRIVEANSQAAKLIELGDYIDKSLAKGTDDKIWSGWTQQLKSAVSTGETHSFDHVDYTFEGQTRLLRILCTALKEVTTARNLGGTLLIEDITETVNIQRELANAERLAAVGMHASKVAHELNNPLDGILRYINLAMRIVERENLEKPKEYLTQCRQGALRMVSIVSELLEFSRSTYTPLAYDKIQHIIEDALKTMESRAGAMNIRVTRNYTPGMPRIRSGNLFQVFCNLAKNALDAMPDGGELIISTRSTADDTIVVEFSDSGTGLPPEGAQAIFQPFYTTKNKGRGTGLGLAICKDIIESYRGRITAENAPEGGSIFTVYLPAAGKDT
jgi:signal transduction histidine kinase